MRHPKYKRQFKKHDIALIELTNTIEFTFDIQPACLQRDTRDEDQEVPLTVTGWGRTSFDSEFYVQVYRDLFNSCVFDCFSFIRST